MPAAPDKDELRGELARVAASLRAYLEWQEDTGAVGIPRGARPASTAAANHAPPAHAAPPATPAAAAAPPPPAPGPPPEAPPTPFAEPALAAAPPAAAAAPAPPPMDRAAGLLRLVTLAEEVASCTKCGLAETRNKTVFSRGNPDAKLCIVGEAPGQDEDRQGLPFVGRAGQLLDKMIGAMGLSSEDDVYVCNILKCRPPGNRRPTPDEMNTCFPYLHEQLAIVAPRVIVAMGNTAVSALLSTTLGITKLRGQWKLYRGTTLVMPTYHPSYLLRPSPQQQQAKREAWEDLQAVMKELGIAAPAKR